MKVAFAGTPQFAATVLRGIAASDHRVALVISQPDAARGRGRRFHLTPVAELARELSVTLAQPDRISAVADDIAACDALVVAAYGQILRPDTLYAAPNGAINVHASLLPKYRGAAPIERAIMAGETETGVTIMRMDEGLDTGPIASSRRVPIPKDATGGELTQTLAEIGANLVVEALGLLAKGSLTFTQQDNKHASYASKLLVEERVIDWGRGVEEVRNLVRALAPHIGARTYHPEVDGPVRILGAGVPTLNPRKLDVGEIYAANERLFVGCGDGVLEVERLQFPGGRAMSASDLLRGRGLSGAFRR